MTNSVFFALGYAACGFFLRPPYSVRHPGTLSARCSTPRTVRSPNGATGLSFSFPVSAKCLTSDQDGVGTTGTWGVSQSRFHVQNDKSASDNELVALVDLRQSKDVGKLGISRRAPLQDSLFTLY